MKTTMLKKQISVTRVLAAILCLGVLSYSITSLGYTVTEEEIRLNCPTKICRVGEEESGTWISYPGQPNRQYILETLGLASGMQPVKILKPIYRGSAGTIDDGNNITVGVTARCGQRGDAYMAKDGAVVMCEEGEGLWVKVDYLINKGTPKQYQYVGKLTTVDYDENDWEDEELLSEGEEGMGMQDTIRGVENLKLGSSLQMLLPPMGLATMDCSMGFSN